MSPDDSKHITQGSHLLTILDRLSDRNAAIRMQCLPKEGHEAVEAKEQRSRALNSSSRCPGELGCPQKWFPDTSASCASLTMGSAVWVGSVEKSAFGGRLPEGSRVSAHRIGKGSEPSDTTTPCPCRSPQSAPPRHTNPG